MSMDDEPIPWYCYLPMIALSVWYAAVCVLLAFAY